SGAGLVKVAMTCKNEVRRVTIDPSLLADDKDMLEDLVAAAFNDAVRKAEATAQEKMSGMTAGLPLPPGFKLPHECEAAIRACRADRSAAHAARRRPEIGAAHRLSPDAARSRRRAAPGAFAGARDAGAEALRTLQHVHRARHLRAVR
ncbi:hypothetical protein DFQ30_011259, partial [Apophysomyces sp. BC1015]